MTDNEHFKTSTRGSDSRAPRSRATGVVPIVAIALVCLGLGLLASRLIRTTTVESAPVAAHTPAARAPAPTTRHDSSPAPSSDIEITPVPRVATAVEPPPPAPPPKLTIGGSQVEPARRVAANRGNMEALEKPEKRRAALPPDPRYRPRTKANDDESADAEEEEHGDGDLLGTWTGEHTRHPASLTITRQEGDRIRGTMTVDTGEGEVRIAVSGFADRDSGSVTLRETRVLSPNRRSWDLGTNEGRITSGGELEGRGSDARGRTYSWRFSR